MKRIKVLRVKAHCYPEIVRIPLGLDSLQKEVGGPIQAVYPWDDPVALICNEEGKLDIDAVEHYNRVLATELGIPYDIVVGTFLIVGLTEDDFGSLSPELLEKYEKLFHNPEEFSVRTDAHGKMCLDVHPCKPEDGMNYNRVLATEIGVPYDVVVGPFLIVGLTEDDFGNLPQEFIDKYEKMFHDPEEFSFWTDAHGKTHLDVRPYVPEDNAK